MKFFRKLPVPKELKEQFPADERIVKIKQERDPEIRRIFEGKSDKLLLIIGPCSADREDAVLDYLTRLSKVQEKVKDKIDQRNEVNTNVSVIDQKILEQKKQNELAELQAQELIIRSEGLTPEILTEMYIQKWNGV